MENEKDVLLKTPIFDVVRAEPLPSGMRPVKVDAPDWVTVFVRRGSEVLVERQVRFGNGAEVEEFPCGMVEPGEEPAAAAARELAEETGLKVDPADLVYLGSASPNPAFMTNTMHWYLADLDSVKSETVPLKLDRDEQLTSGWTDFREFCKRTLEQCKTGGNKVPAMLLAALALEGMLAVHWEK